VVKILFLSELFYPHGGGAELAIYLYAKLLSSAGFNVIVVTNRFYGEPEFSNSEGFGVYRLPLFGKTANVKYSILKRVDVLLSVFMRRLLKWADVVYVPRFWFSAIPLAKALGKPVITHLHDYIPICPLAVKYDMTRGGVCERQNRCSLNCIVAYEKRKRGLTKIFGSVFLNTTVWCCLREFMGLSDFIICVSRAQRDIIVKYLPSLAAKVRVIYNPLPSLSPVEVNGDDFGYFGGSSYLKGFHVLLNALHYRRREGYKLVTVHATKFSKINERHVGLLGDLGFAVYGKLDSWEYDKVYRKIKAVVVPSIWHEPLPYVVAEAILRGRIVIASSVGGIPEQVDGCKGVFLLKPGNWRELERAIEEVSTLTKEAVIDLGMRNREVFHRKQKNENVLRNFVNTVAVCQSLKYLT